MTVYAGYGKMWPPEAIAEITKLRAALEAIKARYEKDSWAYVYATEALADEEEK